MKKLPKLRQALIGCRDFHTIDAAYSSGWCAKEDEDETEVHSQDDRSYRTEATALSADSVLTFSAPNYVRVLFQ